MKPIALFIAVLLPLGLIVTAHAEQNPIVAVYFYAWYGEGLGGRHWNDSAYTPIVDEPLIGYYSSLDPDTIEWQLRLLKQAGIDVLFISWWGPNSYEDRAARLVFENLKRFDLKAAILVEPYLGGDPSLYDYEWWLQVLDYIKKNYIDKYPSVYFRWEGKPLVLAYNPIGMKCRPNTDEFTVRIVGNDIDNAGYQDWDLWPDYLAPWTTDKPIELRVRQDGYVAIAPRFDDRVFCELGVRTGCDQRLLDPNYTLQAYVKQWEWILQHKDQVRLIAIYSWNEYHERSQIEPHYDATKPEPLVYDPYALTRAYTEKLRGIEYSKEYKALAQGLGQIMGVAFLAGAAAQFIRRA
ncbi:hypothetical protein [Pyrodictium abyssi]|uniref:Uncharacterized protein n=1 Tax=Pyrodictium abyssi TaxID=54256 RepID=A0ABN6ZK71_9CREN|nr:hypothetical protein PABY_02070 [Pyrodictium abyssi]